MAGSLDEDVEKLRQSLNGLPQPQVEPPLIVVRDRIIELRKDEELVSPLAKPR